MSLIICIIGALLYLLLDAVEKYSAVKELARLAAFAGMLAWLMGK